MVVVLSTRSCDDDSYLDEHVAHLDNIVSIPDGDVHLHDDDTEPLSPGSPLSAAASTPPLPKLLPSPKLLQPPPAMSSKLHDTSHSLTEDPDDLRSDSEDSTSPPTKISKWSARRNKKKARAASTKEDLMAFLYKVAPAVLSVVFLVSFTSFYLLIAPLPLCLMENAQEPTGFAHPDSKWNYVNCWYFGIVSVTTVGFGDITPLLWYSRLYFFFYAFFGIIGMGTSISIIGSIIVLFVQLCIKHAVTTTRRLSEKYTHLLPFNNKHNATKSADKKIASSFHMKPLVKASYMFLFIILYLLTGSMVFALLEGWNYFDSIYFSFVALTTIGYGDITPKSVSAKLLLVLYLMGGLGAVASLIGFVAEEVLRRAKDTIDKKSKQKFRKLFDKKMRKLVLTTGLDSSLVDNMSPEDLINRLTQEWSSPVENANKAQNNELHNRKSILHPDEQDDDMISNPDLSDFSAPDDPTPHHKESIV